MDEAELASITRFLDSAMVALEIPGISFAVFNSEGVRLEHVAGVVRSGSEIPVTRGTVFEAASITKPLFAWGVQSLAHEGLLDLDAPLASLVDPIPDLAADHRAQLLTPRLLLSHQGGLPNWRARLNIQAQSWEDLFTEADTLRFVGEPGEDYLYSGEGFVLLQRALSAGLGLSLPALLESRVFGPAEMTHSTAAFEPPPELDPAPLPEIRFDLPGTSDFSFGHLPDGTPDKWRLSVPLASSTLHTTAGDLARFGALMAREIRIGGPHTPVFQPQVVVEDDGDRRLEWGLGFGLITVDGARYIFHGGNNVIFLAHFIYSPTDDLGYVLLTNSASGQRLIDALELRVFGVNMPR